MYSKFLSLLLLLGDILGFTAAPSTVQDKSKLVYTKNVHGTT